MGGEKKLSWPSNRENDGKWSSMDLNASALSIFRQTQFCQIPRKTSGMEVEWGHQMRLFLGLSARKSMPIEKTCNQWSLNMRITNHFPIENGMGYCPRYVTCCDPQKTSERSFNSAFSAPSSVVSWWFGSWKTCGMSWVKKCEWQEWWGYKCWPSAENLKKKTSR